jgi:beta-glucosidase
MTAAHDNQAGGEKVRPPHTSPLLPLINPGTFYPTDEWLSMHRRHQEEAAPTDLLLLGDSILYGWTWTGRPEIWQTHFGRFRTANLAVSGDYIQHLLWRIENGKLPVFQPRAVILLIGANNLDQYEAVEIVKGISKILLRVRRGCSGALIRLTGIFPRGPEPDTPVRRKIIEVNERLAALAAPGEVEFDNPGPTLLEPDGAMTRRMFYDWRHPNVEGYRRWAEYLEPRLQSLT